MFKIVTLEETKNRLFKIHGNQVKIIEESYINFNTKAVFIDEKYGEWQAEPKNVCGEGNSHPLRGKEKFKNTFIKKAVKSIDKIKQKIFEVHGDEIKLKEETYKGKGYLATFIDIDYGEWQAYPKNICKGVGHIKRKGKKISILRKMSLEEVKQRIYDIHKNQVKIIEETFINATKKCKFIDIDYGEFEASVRCIYNGQSHPKRKTEKTQKTNIEKYGCKNTFQLPKSKETLFKNYGVDNAAKSEIVKNKQKLTVQNKTKEEKNETKNRYENSMIEKYGVKNPSQSKEISLKISNTRKNKSQEEKDKTRKKFEQSCFENHGYKSIFQSPEIRSKINFKENYKKAHLTKKRNGTYGKSIQEDQFYEFLLTIFEQSDIERQIFINDWNIDFYIKSKQLFIQFDGEYYHGLDRPLEEIKLFNYKIDKIILETYYRDQEQNKWFPENKLKLIRVICKTFKELNLDQIKQEILTY